MKYFIMKLEYKQQRVSSYWIFERGIMYFQSTGAERRRSNFRTEPDLLDDGLSIEISEEELSLLL